MIIGRNRTLLAVPAGMGKRRDKIHVSLLNQRHFLRSEKNRVLVLGRVQTRPECEDGGEEGGNDGKKSATVEKSAEKMQMCVRACVWEGSEWFIGQLCAVF